MARRARIPYLPREIMQRVASHMGPRNGARLAMTGRTGRAGVANHRAVRAPVVRNRWRTTSRRLLELRRNATLLTMRGYRFAASANAPRVPRERTVAVASRGELLVTYTRDRDERFNRVTIAGPGLGIAYGLIYDGTRWLTKLNYDELRLMRREEAGPGRQVIDGILDALTVLLRRR